MSADEHHEKAGQDPVMLAIVTVSDSRTPETDSNRQYLEARLSELGHQVLAYRLIRDEPDEVEAALRELAAHPRIQMLLFNGGTGISPRDRTYDVIHRMIEKPLPGFGELFRMLSYAEVGASAMMSRATAGVYQGVFVVSMPGSNNAVRTAMEKLIIPEINHLTWEMKRQQ